MPSLSTDSWSMWLAPCCSSKAHLANSNEGKQPFPFIQVSGEAGRECARVPTKAKYVVEADNFYL